MELNFKTYLIKYRLYFHSMIESQRPMGSKIDYNYDYQVNTQIQQHPSFFNKFFFFNRIAMVYTYITNLKKQTLYRYNDNFKPVLTSTRILESYFKRKEENQPFNITNELFRLEKRTLVTLFILSIAAGACSLVPVYFQSVLVKAIIGNISDYGALYAIIGAIIGRFFLLNYVLNLSSNIAINVKLQLQNTFMRAIFYLEQSKYDLLKNRIKYLDVDLVGEAIYYIPYIITSIILIFGAVGLTFIYVSPYAVIVVGIYIFLIAMIIIIGRFSLHNMKLSRRRVAQRERFSRRSVNNLLNAAFERMSDYVYQFLVIQKTLEAKLNIKINLQYILGQTLGQCCIVASAITLFALAHNDSITYTNAYYAVLFLTTTFYPMRYSVYGFFTALKAYEAYRQIRLELSNVSKDKIREMRFRSTPHLDHVFAENIGPCFEYTYNHHPDDPAENNLDRHQGLEIHIDVEQLGQSEHPELQLKHTSSENSLSNEAAGIKMKTSQTPSMPTFKDLAVEGGVIIMIFAKVDSLSAENFYKQLLRKKHPSMSATKITARQFMLPDTLKQNICFYSPFDQEKYNKILEITQLQQIVKELSAAQHKSHGGNGGQQYIKFCQWHSTRIQIARALYNNVQLLLIDKPNFLQDEDLVKNVIAYRKQNKKITLISNNIYWNYYRLADKVLVFDKSTYQFGDYTSLEKNHKSLLNVLFLHHRQSHNQIEKIPELPFKDFLPGVVTAPRVEQNTIEHLEKGTFFQLFGLVHKKSQFIVIAALFAAPCLKYYCQYLIGTSTAQRIFWTYFGFGLGYLFLVFIRGLTLSIYTNYGSLSLYQKICRKNRRFNAHQIMQLSQRPVFDFDYHQRIIDRNLVKDFQYGQSILIEIMINFIVLCTGNPLYIAVAIPIIIGIVFVNSFFAKNARKIYLLKLKETKGVHKIVSTVVEKALRIARYQKADDFNKLFQQQNKIETIYDLNIQWLQTGVRTSAQFIVFVCFIVFLIIMIKTVQNISTYTSLVSLGCSMFINLLYLNTFYLKAFRQMEISLYSLTLCFDKLRSPPLPTPRQVGRDQHFYLIKRIMQVQSIRYRDVSLNYFKNVCDKINLTINQGDRLVMSGNNNSFKEMVFYMLKNKIFDRDEVRGDIIINGQSEQEFIIDGLFYLHSDPVLPFFGTVYQALKLSDTSLIQSQLQMMLLAFFNIVGTDPLFESNTPVDHLTLAQKQLFQLFRVLRIQKCKVLVIVNGLDHIDIITRRRLTKYLLRNRDINILIQTTNISDIVHLYPRRFIFKNLKVYEQNLKLQEAHSLRRQLESKQSLELLIERPQEDKMDQTISKFESTHPFNPFL